jgi:hypothetical protein
MGMKMNDKNPTFHYSILFSLQSLRTLRLIFFHPRRVQRLMGFDSKEHAAGTGVKV